MNYLILLQVHNDSVDASADRGLVPGRLRAGGSGLQRSRLRQRGQQVPADQIVQLRL